MNNSRTLKNTIAASMAAMVILFAASCTKDYETGEPLERNSAVTPLTDKDDQYAINAMSKRLPDLGIYNSTMDKVIVFDAESNYKSFSFSSPNPGWNFSNSEQVYFAPAPQGGGILYVGAGSFGGNTGGTVVAGNSSLDINYTFCFAASDDALGLDFGFGGPDFDGLSVVIGIAGDFETLTTGEYEEDEIFDFFQGFAVYIVYDNEASGSYPVLNWFDDLEEDADDLEGNSFAYVLAFADPAGIYFSKSGSLNVSGGSISFSGIYWGIAGDIFGGLFEEEGEEVDDPEYVEVEGFGTMGCS